MSEVCFWYGTSCHCGRMIGSTSRHGSARHRLVFVELVFGYNDMVQTMESQNSSLVQTHRQRFEMESWRWAKNTFRCAGYLQPIWSQHIIWSEGNIYLCLSWRVGVGFLLGGQENVAWQATAWCKETSHGQRLQIYGVCRTRRSTTQWFRPGILRLQLRTNSHSISLTYVTSYHCSLHVDVDLCRGSTTVRVLHSYNAGWYYM